MGYSMNLAEANRLHVVSKRRNSGPGLVGRNLKRLRDAMGISQETLAERAGKARVTISKIETGAQGDVSVEEMVVPLAAALGVRPGELLEVEVQRLPIEPLIEEFKRSPWAVTLKPPATEEDFEKLRGVPDSFWYGVKPSPEALARLIETLRSDPKGDPRQP